MGAKTGLLAFGGGDLRAAIRHAGPADLPASEALVRRVHPGHAVERTADSTLFDGTYPPTDVTYAAVTDRVSVVCDQRLMLDRPSRLPAHLLALAGGGRMVLHAMHSVVDFFAFGVWEDGRIVRSLSLSPDSGVPEDIGTPLPFEAPFWAGSHPVEPVPGWPDRRPYPLPFHPLHLGEEALRALVGFTIEGQPDETDVDADAIATYGFHVTDPTGQEQRSREAAMARALAAMGPPRRFRMGPDGGLVEVEQ
ncbi:DUF6928 family protein [Micromonospora sp. NPDC051006]|uniref:DUF6928 family protein n=1 Tax=Micromonospora sp. NPDC051006 TaxID=3364283 RepID=UPI0037B2869F